MAGRGSFIESFPLFGYDLADYDRLFEEKLRRLLEVRGDPAGNGVYPLPVQQPLPVWVAVGGAPESAVRAGRLGLPMAIAIIGGRPDRFAGFAELHREAARRAGYDPGSIPISINSHGFIAETSQAAADAAWPPFEYQMTKIGRERGWPPVQRQDFDAGRTLHGALFVGSPAEVTEKILYQHEIFNHDRFLLQLSVGTMPHLELLRAIELYGTEVAPAVRAALTPAAVS
jgi:alkanesulfonate monooxygenase SsuD/methylene tetrahydromethanopterin reductase-like flavin-dependent oxidoreductase (luciferase family)